MSIPRAKLVGYVKVGEHFYLVRFRETKSYYVDTDGLKFHKETGEVIIQEKELEDYNDTQLVIDSLELISNKRPLARRSV